MTNVDSVLKSRGIPLPTKVHLVKAMIFPVVMYGYESWNIKKAESWRIDAFERWCWRRLLRVPWTTRRTNQSILKEISPGCSLERPMLKLKRQYFGHLIGRADSFEKTLERLKVGGEGDDKGWDGWMASLTQWTWVWASSGRWWRIGKPVMLKSIGLPRLDTTERLINNSDQEITERWQFGVHISMRSAWIKSVFLDTVLNDVNLLQGPVVFSCLSSCFKSTDTSPSQCYVVVMVMDGTSDSLRIFHSISKNLIWRESFLKQHLQLKGWLFSKQQSAVRAIWHFIQWTLHS